MSNTLYNFNPGKKSWKIYANELTSISGDDLKIFPNENKDIILEVSGNGNILFKEDGITYNLADLSNAVSSSSNVNLTNYDDASLNNLDISGVINFFATDEQLLGPDTGIAQKVQDLSNNLLTSNNDASFNNVDINGGIIITVNDVNSQNITLLELKTNSNTPRIKHDFWQNSSGYADYQIYPSSASTTDFKIGGYNTTFETIRLNALNGIEVYSNQSTNTYGNIKCNDATVNQVNATTLSSTSGNGLVIQTNPTTQAIEFRTGQIYPQTNNTTILGGANNRWSTGYFNSLNTYGVTSDLHPPYDAGGGSPNLYVGSGSGWRWFGMSCYTLYYGTGGQGSDDRIKHNEVDVSNGLDIIRQLTPKKYKKSLKMYDADYNGEIEGDWNWETGFIAQEILKIPDLSFSVKGGDRMVDGELKEECHSVDYNSIFSYNIAATKELDTIIQQQAQMIKALEARLLALESK